MRVLGEHVEDRQLVLGRKRLELGVGVRPHPDRGDVTTQDARGVAQRLAPAELRLARAQDHRMAAHLDDARLEAHARPGARLLEDERDRAALQDAARARRELQRGGAIEDRVQVVGGELGSGQQVAHGRAGHHRPR